MEDTAGLQSYRNTLSIPFLIQIAGGVNKFQLLSGVHVNFLKITCKWPVLTYAHIRHVIWICVLLFRFWPSGEPDNSCTPDAVMDARPLDCVCAQTFATICHARDTFSSHSRAQGRDDTPDTYPFFFLFHFAFDSLRGCDWRGVAGICKEVCR